MADSYRTEGFILKKSNRGEADQLFTIYTKDFGKIEILGKGIRKIKSKLRSGADIFCFSEIEFIQGKTYKTLTGASTIEKFPNLRKNLIKLRIANKIAEVIDNLIRGQEKDEEIFNFLNDTFKKLNNLSLAICHWSSFYYYFIWNLLSILGYKINLYQCVICHRKLTPQKLYFCPREGGIIDFNCSQKISDKEIISPEIIKIIRLFLKRDWETLLKIKPNDDYQKPLRAVSESYFQYYKKKE